MNKKWRVILGSFLLVGLLAVGGGWFYLKSQMYAPSEEARSSAKLGTVEQATLVFKGKSENPAIIFYQGALVEKESYSIWASEVAKQGYSVYLVQMPLNLAVFGINQAQKIIKENHIERVVLGGHSLGGVMASRFSAKHMAAVKGVFFLASYPDDQGSLARYQDPVLSLTGSKDGVLNQKAYQKAKMNLPKQTIYEQIEGGNHAGFGSYGRQKGDNQASITNQAQQHQIANALVKWLATVKKDF